MKISKSIILPLLALLVTFSSLAEAVKIGECSSRGSKKEQVDDSLKSSLFDFLEVDLHKSSNKLTVKIKNKSAVTIRAIKTWEQNYENLSYIFHGEIAPFTTGRISGDVAWHHKQGSSWFVASYEYGYVQGDCLHVWTKEDQDRARMRQIEQDAKKSLADRRERMLHRCIVAKSKGVPESAISSVQRTCLDIIDNPSFLDKIRYGD